MFERRLVSALGLVLCVCWLGCGGGDGAADPDAMAQADAMAPADAAVTPPDATAQADAGTADAAVACPDSDGDGVCDDDDVCPGGDDSVDLDGDGVPDACDVCPGVYDPEQRDSHGIRARSIPFAAEPAGGTSITSCTMEGPLSLGFTFSYFGTEYTTLSISADGALVLGSGHFGYENAQLMPCGSFSGSAEPLIAAAWTALAPTGCTGANAAPGAGTITYETRGTEPERRFVVTWDEVALHVDSTRTVTAQAVLYEGSNRIELHTASIPEGPFVTRGMQGVFGGDNVASYLMGQNRNQYAIENEAIELTTDDEPDGVGDDCDNTESRSELIATCGSGY
jgi:hypothetical protein